MMKKIKISEYFRPYMRKSFPTLFLGRRIMHLIDLKIPSHGFGSNERAEVYENIAFKG